MPSVSSASPSRRSPRQRLAVRREPGVAAAVHAHAQAHAGEDEGPVERHHTAGLPGVEPGKAKEKAREAKGSRILVVLLNFLESLGGLRGVHVSSPTIHSAHGMEGNFGERVDVPSGFNSKVKTII